MEEGLAVEPTNRLLQDRLGQLLESRLDWKPLAKLWQTRLEQSDDHEDKASLAFQLARLHLDRLQQADTGRLLVRKSPGTGYRPRGKPARPENACTVTWAGRIN